MIKYHSLVFCVKFFLKPIFMVCSFLNVSFLCRINLDNRVLLISCVDFLKTKFTISLSEPWVDHSILLLEMNIFQFQLKFSSVESMEAFNKSTDLANSFGCQQKSLIIPPPDLRLNFLLKGTAYQNHNYPVVSLLFQQVTKNPWKEKRLCQNN